MSVVDGRTFRSPASSIQTGLPVLERNLTIEQILERRNYKRPATNAKAVGCRFGVGLSERNGQPLVLLSAVEEGRVVEIPHRGVFVLRAAQAQALAEPGRCTPAPRASDD